MAAIGRYAFFLRFYNDSRSAILQTIICTQEKRFLLAGGFGAYPEKFADECVDCAASCRGLPMRRGSAPGRRVWKRGLSRFQDLFQGPES